MIEPKIGVPFEYEGRWYVGRKCKDIDQCEHCAFKSLICWAVACVDDQTPEGVTLNFRPLRLRTLMFRWYDWVESDPIGQRFKVGYMVVVVLGLSFCLFGLGLLAGRGGL